MWDRLLLRLPGDLQQRFLDDSSVQSLYIRFDCLALTHVMIAFTRFARVFSIHSAAATAMTLPQRVSMALFVAGAAAQLAWIAFAPISYRRHRYPVTLANRLVRLAAMAAIAVINTPADAQRQVMQYVAVVMPPAPAAAAAAGSGGVNATDALLAAASPSEWSHRAAIWRSVFITPVMHLWPSYHMLPFSIFLPFQIVTLFLSYMLELRPRTCALLQDYPHDRTVPAAAGCAALSRAARVAGALLGLDTTPPPGVDDQSNGAAAALCGAGDLTAFVLLKVAAHLFIILAAPCLLVYAVEWSWKGRFLARLGLGWDGQPLPQQHDGDAAAGAGDGASSSGQHQLAASRTGAGGSQAYRRQPAAAAAAAAAAGSSSSRRAAETQQQPQQQRQPQQPTQPQQRSVQLLPLGGAGPCGLSALSLPASVLLTAAACVVTALACWWAAEVAVLLVLNGGRRRFACDSVGWLTIVS